MALALAGSSLGAGPAGRRRSRRSRPSDFKMAHTVWADTGLPCAVKALAISVTDWSSARRTSTRSRTVLVLRGPLGPGLVERKKLVRPARSSAASPAFRTCMRLGLMAGVTAGSGGLRLLRVPGWTGPRVRCCLLYTSDAADE